MVRRWVQAEETKKVEEVMAMVVRRGRMQAEEAEEAEKAVVVRRRRMQIRHQQGPTDRIRHQQGREEVTAVVVRRRRMQAEEVEEAEDAEKAEEVGRRRLTVW